jgi:hypothetical protein
VKGIGIVVLLLVVGLGSASYFFTRPPDRALDATERNWVTRYQAWATKTERVVDRAFVGLGTLPATNARLLAPLRRCSASVRRLGDAPEPLKDVRESAEAGCGEVEYAVSVNDRFAAASLATTKQHLNRAEEWLVLGRRQLHEAVVPDG